MANFLLLKEKRKLQDTDANHNSVEIVNRDERKKPHTKNKNITPVDVVFDPENHHCDSDLGISTLFILKETI